MEQNSSQFPKLSGNSNDSIQNLMPLKQNIDIGGNYTFTNAPEPINDSDLATKLYVDTHGGGGWIGNLNQVPPPISNYSFNNKKLTNLANATSSTDAMNMQSTVSAFDTRISVTPMSDLLPSNIDMQSHEITNLSAPTTDYSAANKFYVDNKKLNEFGV